MKKQDRLLIAAWVLFGIWLFFSVLLTTLFGGIGIFLSIISGISMIAGWVRTPSSDQNQGKGEGK